MNVITWWGQDFWLLIELGDLLSQYGDIRPARSISIRNPPCSQIPKAVEEKFHMLLARSFAKEVRNRKRSPEQGVAAGNLARTLCDDREGHSLDDRGHFIRRQISHGDGQNGRVHSGNRGGRRAKLFKPGS